jgi:RecB family exonuclease
MFTSWSFSRFKDWRECPRRAQYKHLMKLPEGEKSPALLRGEQIHKMAEDYVKGKGSAKVPPSLNVFAKAFQELRKMKAITEGKWAMTVQWKPTGFFEWKAAWVRLVLDAHYRPASHHARVIDYKTGRIYGDNLEQMELYAIGGKAHYPEVEVVSTELWYLDQPLVASGKNANPRIVKFDEAKVIKLQKHWREKVTPMLTDRKFIPRPGEQCARCAYSKRRGGPCKY